MKKVISLLILIISSQIGNSCSCPEFVNEFCTSADTSDFIALVELIEFEDNSVAIFKRIENLNKSIPDTISVLGSDGLNCNETLTNFSIGDTLIVNFDNYSPIGEQSAQNLNFYDWGINGCTRHFLTFISDIVFGGITNIVDQTSFKVFKESIMSCIDFKVNISDIQVNEINIYPNPSSGIYLIEIINEKIQKIDAFNINGQSIEFRLNVKGNIVELDISENQRGIYQLIITSKTGILSNTIVKI